MAGKASPYQRKVLQRILEGERLVAPRNFAHNGTCIGLGIHRFPDKTAVKLETVMSLRHKGLVITRDVRDHDQYGFSGYSEVIPQ